MRVKKFNGKVYGAAFTAAERKAMELEIDRQIAAQSDALVNQIDTLVLYVLHERFGFGKKRLRRFFDAFGEEYERLVKRYEMPDEGVFIADLKLREMGIDVAKWNDETGKEV